MRALRALLCLAAALPILAAAAACGGEKPPPPRLPAEDTTVAVAGPTVVVAWRRVSQAEVDADEDLALVLFDFERYVANVTPVLQQAGFTVHQVGARRVRVADAGRQVADVQSEQPRYILAAPGRPPRVIEGLQTDAALLRAAADYFDRPELRPQSAD
jgi:hypothetical protein